jgi:hypothetical protein
VLPTVTGLGVPLLVTARSQAVATFVTTVVLLLAELGSVVLADTEELAVMVAAVTDEATLTATMMSAEALAARLESVQFTVPVAPTAGVVQDQPTGAETDWNVVLVGIASVKLTDEAAAGPLLVTVWV